MLTDQITGKYKQYAPGILWANQQTIIFNNNDDDNNNNSNNDDVLNNFCSVLSITLTDSAAWKYCICGCWLVVSLFLDNQLIQCNQLSCYCHVIILLLSCWNGLSFLCSPTGPSLFGWPSYIKLHWEDSYNCKSFCFIFLFLKIWSIYACLLKLEIIWPKLISMSVVC